MENNHEFMKIFACPRCGSPFSTKSSASLVCLKCGAVYPIMNGIPILLIDQANELSYENFSQTKTESIKFYEDFYKGHYDYRRFSGPDRGFVRQIFNRLKFVSRNPVIVDLGAGTGYFGKLFEEVKPGYQVYNADFSYEGFRTAQEVYGLDKLAVMDAYRVAFLPNTIDAMFTIGLTPFKKKEVKDLSFLIEQIAQPIKSGGYFVFIWSSNLRDTIDETNTIRSDQEVTKTFYYNHSRATIENALSKTQLFSMIKGYTFLRPFSMFLGPLLLTKPITWLTEAAMRFAPKSFTARIVVIGTKK